MFPFTRDILKGYYGAMPIDTYTGVPKFNDKPVPEGGVSERLLEKKYENKNTSTLKKVTFKKLKSL